MQEKKMAADEIRQMLKDLDWSEGRLADEANVTVYAVYKWLEGRTHPTRLRARRLRAIRDKYLRKPEEARPLAITRWLPLCRLPDDGGREQMKQKQEKKMTADEIRQMLKELDWTEAKLADQAEVTIYAVYGWLAGRAHPARLRARKLRAIWDKQLKKPESATP